LILSIRCGGTWLGRGSAGAISRNLREAILAIW
jgi:hypothetical protein